jgi:hypothetical protein
MGAQERMVRLTLTAGPTDDPMSPVTIPGGQVSPLDAIATNISINPADPAFQQPFNKDENVMTYGRREGPLENIDMHQSVVYEVSMKEGEQTTLVPIGIAKIQFGDWDIRPGGRSPINPRCTYEAERNRVAMNWGGYELFPYVRRGASGTIMADTRKIAPPKVPKVIIQEIDQRGNVIGEIFDPWQFYRWEEAVDRQAAAEARRRQADEGFAPVPAPAPVASAVDFEAMVEAAVNKRLGKQKAVTT